MIFTLKFCFDLYANLIFSVLYGANKILRAIALLFNSIFFQSFEESSGKFISFQSNWLIKDLIFDIPWGIFSMFHDLMQRLKHMESNYYHYFLDLLLLFYFLAIQENLYIIHGLFRRNVGSFDILRKKTIIMQIDVLLSWIKWVRLIFYRG